MGYYSYFELSAYKRGRHIDTNEEMEICHFLNTSDKISGYLHIKSFSSLRNDSMKWYDHDKDMLALSKAFPNIVFVLTGEGEERDDNWISYYKNGQMETCRGTIVYDEPCSEFAVCLC